MSTHKCEVVRILLEEHPNADSLSVVKVHGYECAVRTQDWNDGDLAVYIPPDSTVPDTEPFKFLGDSRRIRVRKFRGRYSQGLLVPAPEGMQEGDDCMEMMGIEHYEPPLPMKSGGENEKGPEGFFPVYDIEDYNRYADAVFESGEEVVATEKIHGASAKFVCAPDIKSAQDLLATAIQLGEELPDSDLGGMLEHIGRARGRITSSQAICDLECISEGGGVRFIGNNSTIPSEWNHKADFIAEHIQKAIINLKGRIWAGSRKNWKKHDEKVWWWQAVVQNPRIEEWCRAHPGLALYGEVFGPTQKMKYGAKQNQMLFRAFDILDKDRWLDYDESREVGMGLEWVPEVYRGPLDDNRLRALAEENSSVPGADHHREGLVVKPVTERRSAEVGRVQLKLKSNRYLAKN